jgi:hypothetical protein
MGFQVTGPFASFLSASVVQGFVAPGEVWGLYFDHFPLGRLYWLSRGILSLAGKSTET